MHKKLNEIFLAKFFERKVSREIFRKPISSWQNFSARSFRKEIHLLRGLIVQGYYDLVRVARALKTEKNRQGTWDHRVFS